MTRKIEEIIDKINVNKEILSTMPKNNLKNINIYQIRIQELKEEYENYKKDISSRLQRRYKIAVKNQTNNEEIDNIEKRLKTVNYLLQLLDNKKTSYEKMELDRNIYTITKYYKENLENINEQIKLYITKFSKSSFVKNICGASTDLHIQGIKLFLGIL